MKDCVIKYFFFLYFVFFSWHLFSCYARLCDQQLFLSLFFFFLLPFSCYGFDKATFFFFCASILANTHQNKDTRKNSGIKLISFCL
jgi:hypothetical protein